MAKQMINKAISLLVIILTKTNAKRIAYTGKNYNKIYYKPITKKTK